MHEVAAPEKPKRGEAGKKARKRQLNLPPLISRTMLPDRRQAPLQRRASDRNRVRNALAKSAFAVALFAAIIGGWTWMTARQQLPGATGRQGACALWFVGSSTMARWPSLQSDFAPWATQNRGIGGAAMTEINRAFANDKATRAPKAIVYYAGDNDLAFGRTVDEAIADMREFLTIKSRLFGATPVFVLSLKPSPTRWELRGQQTRFNVIARRISGERPDVFFIDTVSLLLEGGRPGPYYAEDGLHLNDEGYRRWAVAVRRALTADMPREAVKQCDPGSLN